MTDKKEFGVFTGDEIFNYSNEKKAIIEHFLYERDCMCIDSKAGEGKTLVALTLICNLTTGTPFLDTYTIDRPRKVLYVQTEGDRAETLERLQLISHKTPINNDNWVHLNWDGLTLNTPEGFKIFEDLIAIHPMKYDVIIFDPLYTTVKGSLSSDEVSSDWTRNIRKLRETYNCAILALAHKAKETYLQNGQKIERGADNLFGSVYWSAFLNQNFKLDNVGGMLTLTRGKQRSTKIVDLIEMKIVETDDWLLLTNKEDLSDRNSVVIFDIIEKAGKPVSVKTLFKESEIPESTVHRAVRKLMNERRIERIKVGRAYLYQLLKEDIKSEKLKEPKEG